jgi:hypothetical protein
MILMTKSRILTAMLPVLLFTTCANAVTHSEKISNFTMFSMKREKFSRSRFQLESNIANDLNDRWSIDASARAFVDPGVWSANYLDSVTEDERAEIRLRSLFLEWHGLPWKIRIGLQQIVWGEALHYLSADLLHPKDLRDFYINDLEWARIPQAGLWASYDDGHQNFQFVYFPYSETHKIPHFGSEFFLKRYGAEQFGLMNVRVESKYDFSKPLIGANYGLRFHELDIHFMGVFSKDFQRYYDAARFKNDRVVTGALTASYAYDDFLFRFEEIAYFNRQFNILNSPASISSEKRTQLTTLPVLEYNLFGDLVFSQQLYWAQTLNCSDTQILPCRTIQHGISLHATQLPLKLEFDSSAWIEYKDKSAWWSTKIKRPFGDQLTATVGFEEFFGDGSSIYSELSSHDQLTARLEYNF